MHVPRVICISMYHYLFGSNFLISWGLVGIEADDDRIELLLSQLAGKDITEVIAAGREKLASVPAGGGGVAVAAPAVGGGAGGTAPAAAESKKEEKVEEKEESDEVSDQTFITFVESGRLLLLIWALTICNSYKVTLYETL